MSQSQPSGGKKPRRRFQFTLGSLFLVMAICSVLAAAVGGVVRSQLGELSVPALYFVFMAVAAPLGTMIVVSLALSAARWLRRINRARAKRDERGE